MVLRLPKRVKARRVIAGRFYRMRDAGGGGCQTAKEAKLPDRLAASRFGVGAPVSAPCPAFLLFLARGKTRNGAIQCCLGALVVSPHRAKLLVDDAARGFALNQRLDG